MKGQVAAIALVIASGVALLVMSLSALTSLSATTEAYYDRYRFGKIFAGAKRVPDRLVDRIQAIPGVQTVEARITAYTTLDVGIMAEPVVGRLVSLPERGEPLLNQLALRVGRLVEPDRDDEAVLHEPFAEAHGLNVGDTFEIQMNGAKRRVRIVGIALSPEFVYAIAPGMLMPDDARFAVIWMGRKALAAAYDLEGAFNDVTLGLQRGAGPEEVIARLDPMLERYGGRGAIARADQTSHWFLTNELEQLRTMATVLPAIFLTVTAFLVNTVLARLIATERHEISLMKAFGYTNLEVAAHYAKMAVAMAAVGILLGWAIGAGLGRYNTALYSEFFRFPFLHYRPTGMEFALSAGISLFSALFGAAWAVRRAVALAPAEAMRPPAPESYRGSVLPTSAARWLDQPTRMLLRQIARSRARSLMTVAGVALSIAVLVMAMRIPYSIDTLASSYFSGTQRQDVTVGFFEPRAAEGRFALARMPGVLAVEPMRIVPADLVSGRKLHRGAVTGLPAEGRLNVIADVRGWTLPVPRGGIVLGTKLADKLTVDVGDTITVEVLEGARPRLEVQVVGLHDTYMGMPAYMNLAALNRALGDPPVFGHANLLVDMAYAPDFYSALKELPAISTVMVKQGALDTFYDTLGETLLIFISFFVGFGCALVIGVVYNATRIALSERGRELATLRVIGFTRGEISYLLLGEAAFLILLAIPFGCAAAVGLIWVMTKSMETELFRVPFTIPAPAFGWAVVIAIGAGVLAAAIVRRRLDRLDLVAVLKTRE